MATAAAAVLAPPPPQTPQGAAGSDIEHQQGMQFTVAAADASWLTVLPLCAGFFHPVRQAAATAAASGAEAGSGGVRFGAALWNNGLIDLPLAGAELHLTDGLGSFTTAMLPAASNSSNAQPATQLVLSAGAWLQLATIPTGCAGQLQATALVLHFAGGCCSLTFQLSELLAAAAAAPPAGGAAAAGGTAPAAAAGWLRGGWGSGQLPFSTLAG